MNNESEPTSEPQDDDFDRPPARTDVVWLYKNLKEQGIIGAEAQYRHLVAGGLLNPEMDILYLMWSKEVPKEGPALLNLLREIEAEDDGTPNPEWWEEKGHSYKPSPNSYASKLNTVEAMGCQPRRAPGQPPMTPEEKREWVIRKAAKIEAESAGGFEEGSAQENTE